MAEPYLTAKMVAARLMVGQRTLEGWLADYLKRSLDSRRFQFHICHGRKRLWSETRYKELETAIERESAPGDVLAGSRSSSATVCWHVSGTVRAGGRSIRVRRSLGLSATTTTYDEAWDEVRAIEADIRAEIKGDRPRGDPVAVAAAAISNASGTGRSDPRPFVSSKRSSLNSAKGA